jgi:hypothetical protein
MRVASHTEDQYDLTDSTWGFNKTLVVRVVFISHMALAVGKKMVSQHSVISIFPLFMDLVCWLDLLHKISTTFCILVSGLCMLRHNF